MITFGEPQAMAYLAVLARTAAWAYTAPVIGEKAVPGRLKMIAAALIAFALLPVRAPLETANMYTALPLELAFGLLLGSASRTILAGAEAGGQLIGIQLGLGFAGTYDPQAGDESIATKRIAYYLAALAFLQAGGLEASVRALATPLATEPQLSGAMLMLIRETPNVLVHAVRIAAPMLIASFVANIATAIASRASSGVNVFSVMLALFLALGGLVLMETTGHFTGEMNTAGRLAIDVLDKVVNR